MVWAVRLCRGRHCRWLAAAFAVVGCCVLFTHYLYRHTNSPLKMPSRSPEPAALAVVAPVYTAEMYRSRCFSGRRKDDLLSLVGNVRLWKDADDAQCQSVRRKFDTVFEVDVRSGRMDMPAEFEKKVLAWMNGSKSLLEDVRRQKIVRVLNKLELHEIGFNPVRASRPVLTSGGDHRRQVQRAADESRDACDFCRYRSLTGRESGLPRLESTHAAVVSNAFKLDASHALVISRGMHSPLELSGVVLADMLQLAARWVVAVNAAHPALRFPSITMDVGYHAGVSQMHPHMHVFVSPDRYPGEVERLLRAADLYPEEFHRLHGDATVDPGSYWSAVAEVHTALGLAVRLDGALAVISISPLLDGEVWLLLDDGAPLQDLAALWNLVLDTYEMRLRRYCYSSSVVMSPVGAATDQPRRAPTLVRLVTRGDCSAVRSDVSGLELFAVTSISLDPYSVASHLADIVARHASLEP